MSKSILVVDTPKSCRGCQFTEAFYKTIHWKRCNLTRQYNTEYTQGKEGYERHPECPLQDTKELLEALETVGEEVREYGWKYCKKSYDKLYKALGGIDNE